MKILLDTHILFWMHTNTSELTPEIKEMILNPENEVFYSSVNVWEVQIKHMNHPENFTLSGKDFDNLCIQANLKCVPLKSEHVFQLQTLHYDESAPKEHKDPFDRILICQAKFENMKFITHDSLIPHYREDFIIST